MRCASTKSTACPGDQAYLYEVGGCLLNYCNFVKHSAEKLDTLEIHVGIHAHDTSPFQYVILIVVIMRIIYLTFRSCDRFQCKLIFRLQPVLMAEIIHSFVR